MSVLMSFLSQAAPHWVIVVVLVLLAILGASTLNYLEGRYEQSLKGKVVDRSEHGETKEVFCINCNCKRPYFVYTERRALCSKCKSEVYAPEVNDQNVRARLIAAASDNTSEFVGQIIDIFEDFLDIYNGVVDCDDGGVRIAGSDYNYLSGKLDEMLLNWGRPDENV